MPPQNKVRTRNLKHFIDAHTNLVKGNQTVADEELVRSTGAKSAIDNVALEIAAYIRQVSEPDAIDEVITAHQSMRSAIDFSRYVDDIVGFARDVLGVTFWEQQAEIVKLFQTNRSVVVESGNSTGKTFCAALIGLHWLCTHDEAVLITTAPTHVQVNNLLWRYFRQFRDQAKYPLPGIIFETPRWEIASTRFGIGLSPKKGSDIDVTAIQGFHSKNLLAIMDEAAGLPIPLWGAIAGLATGENNRILAIGNPIAKSGPFFDATKSPSFKHLRISCFDHPNVVQKKEIIPGAVSWSWVNARVHDWCRPVSTESAKTFYWEGALYEPLPIFEARVLGRPPDEADNQLISLAWVEAAMREMTIEPTGERVLGLDVARYGDDESAMIFRIGHTCLWVERQRGNSVVQTGEWLCDKIIETNAERVCVDITGGIGAGVVDYCNDKGFNIDGINFSSTAMQKTKFANMRHEMWWAVRERLRKEEMVLPQDETLEADLIAPRLEKPDAQGRIVVEEKDKIRQRLGRSPDSGDALAVSYAGDIVEDGNAITPNYSDALATTSIEKENLPNTSRWIVANKKRSSGKSRWKI